MTAQLRSLMEYHLNKPLANSRLEEQESDEIRAAMIGQSIHLYGSKVIQ